MNVCIFDTETTSIDKPFAYNIGWCIFDTDNRQIIYKADYVAEQIWHNLELFTTAYYAEKRDWYIGQMRSRKITMEKLGYITQLMCRIFKEYDVQAAYAYNSNFDVRVFSFNCDWFKIKNPFDNIPIYDIRGYVHKKIAFDPDYQKFCEKYGLYTDSGNYSTTAESVYKYITNDPDFEESHTALSDSLIELDILKYCIDQGCKWNTAYKVYQTVPNPVDKTLVVKDVDGNKTEFPYNKITIRKEKDKKVKIFLKALDK
jgi:hypothetical protein